MKILITGGMGFIGSALVRSILLNTDAEIINVDKLTYAGNEESLGELTSSKNYFHEKVDICNLSELERVFNEHKPSCVMHLAAESHVDRSIDGPLAFMNTNILGTFNLLEVSKSYFNSLEKSKKNHFKFHHISTDEVFGDLGKSERLFDESTPYSPSSPYSASKAASDHLVRAWGRTYELPFVITNCSNNYGPYQFPEKLIPNVIINALEGNAIKIYGDGLQIRDWLYVEDHVNGLIKVILEGDIGATYNIGGNNQKTNLEVVNSICFLLDNLTTHKPLGIKSYSELITHVKDRPGHDLKYAINASKIKHELGWVPDETFETGLRKTVEWYINNRVWWGRVISGEYHSKYLSYRNE